MSDCPDGKITITREEYLRLKLIEQQVLHIKTILVTPKASNG